MSTLFCNEGGSFWRSLEFSKYGRIERMITLCIGKIWCEIEHLHISSNAVGTSIILRIMHHI